MGKKENSDDYKRASLRIFRLDDENLIMEIIELARKESPTATARQVVAKLQEYPYNKVKKIQQAARWLAIVRRTDVEEFEKFVRKNFQSRL